MRESGDEIATPAGEIADPRTLLGGWRLSRTIEDRHAGQTHRVHGRLQLDVVTDDRIHWHEAGLWHQPNGDVEVERTLWLVLEADDKWWVRFEDGREFHPWSPGAPVSTTAVRTPIAASWRAIRTGGPCGGTSTAPGRTTP